MESLLQKAFEALKTLPKIDRERIAWEIIERVEDKTEWDRIVASPEAQRWMEQQAKEALRVYRKMRDKLSLTFVSVSQDKLLREESYWREFDDLPQEIRKLAEHNYHSWKENPRNPGLRFKQIHQSLPIFSFRVGMRHRTVGVETDDGKIVWFWVGSFETFRDAINT
ncbi:MAG: hypothetical protein JSU82_16505 [Rhodospirillales bacterium]|nr:MAG: hypothetical protein JSU82_16505 [Rhodospirillales bacterium]